MNTHIKSLLSSSGIAKRNVSIPLIGACKVSGNARVPQLISPENQMLRPFNLQTPCQKLIHWFSLYTFSFSQHPASIGPF
jgi:hypothetical protein